MMINQNSDNLSQYNWTDITFGFDIDTMAFIICRIKEEKVVNDVVNCIKRSWDFALRHKDPVCFVTDPLDSRFKVCKYRGEHSIDYVLNQILKSRKTFKDMNDFTSNTNSSKKNVQTEKRITLLEAENKKLNDKNKELKEENERLKEDQLTVVNAEGENVEKKWISCFDTFLDPRLNAEAIAEKLHEINSPHLPRNKRGFWWVVFTVFSEIHWIPTPSKNQKTILQWANLHFDCSWDWRKDNQFKFSDISDKIKTKKSSEWNKKLTGNVIGDYYGELARNIKESFVEIIDGKIIDRSRFILSGCQRINNGRK